MLELKNITFKVKALDSNEEVTILDDISFEIENGKIIIYSEELARQIQEELGQQ